MNENLDRKILGENIKKRRIELGLTQKKLASNLGVSNVSLSQYETGDVNIPLATLNELANILETTVGKLIGTKEEIEYTTDRQTLLNKVIKNTNTLAIAVEKGIDKVENIFAPILKNSLDDIVILDIDGKAYEETVNHRALEEKSLIRKIDFNYKRKFDMIFNPFTEISFSSSVEEIKVITKFLLNEESSEKFDFLNSIIAYYYHSTSLKFKKNKHIDDGISLSYLYYYLANLDYDIVKELTRISELNYLDFEDLNILLGNSNNEIELLKNNDIDLKIPEYHSKLLKLIKLGNEKLNKLKIELLKDLYFLNSDFKFKDKEIEKQIPKKNGNYIIRDNFRLDDELSLNVFKHYDYYNDYIEYLTFENRKIDLSEKEINQLKLRKTYYFVIDKKSFNDLKPLINLFFYFLKKNIKTYNTNYESNKKKMEINPTKNLLVIIDRYSELNLELKDLSKNGVKQILVSDLDKIDKSYFKIENENMKVTKKKMEYLYKVEENGNIDFYKDTCPVSKPKKVSIEDELRTFKEL